jgi:transcription initiation factor TFIIB
MQPAKRDDHQEDDNDEDAAEIREMLARLSVTGEAIAETALRIYLSVKRQPGHSHHELRAASVYASCRLFGVPRTLRDVSAACGMEDVVTLASRYRMVVEETGLTMPVPDPAGYVPRIASRAGLDSLTERRAIEILNSARRLRLTAGKMPEAVAAAALYSACLELGLGWSLDSKQGVTQTQIARAAGISEVTLRNRLWTIRYALDKEPAENGR